MPKERPELNGSFMGQWEASRLAVIPRAPPCPAWGPCCPTPFTVYPELASTGMRFQAAPPQVPATSDSGAAFLPASLSAGSPGLLALPCSATLPFLPSCFTQFSLLGRCGGTSPERTREPVGHRPASRYRAPLDQASHWVLLRQLVIFSAAQSPTLRQPSQCPWLTNII